MNRRPIENQAQLSFAMEPLKKVDFPVQKRTRRKSVVSTTMEEPSLLEVTSPKVMTVSEVTRRVANLLEEGIGEIWIEGEISNYRCQSSGHHYFTLKDAGAQIACVLFARTAATLPNLSLAEGMAVQLYGAVTVYQPRGQYQLMVRLVQAKGQGMLQAKFEALKQRLASEGLFDAVRKRPLPSFPRRLGIVTSPTGAALADFLHVLHRRHPGLQVVINPVRVQGQGAAQEIAAAIAEFSRADEGVGPVDVIVVTRGGGSLEDLWEFNEEIVARAIATSMVPVVSAVGHEIDFTISDFVADVRVPTPSAAAELLAADSIALREKIASLVMRIGRTVTTHVDQLVRQKDFLENSVLFRAPERLFSELRQNIDGLEEVLMTQMSRRLEQLSSKLETMTACLRSTHPQHLITQARHRYNSCEQRLYDQLRHRKALVQARLEYLRSSFAALSPEATLARGFTITRNGAGKVLSSAKKINTGAVLRTQFVDGEILSLAEHF